MTAKVYETLKSDVEYTRDKIVQWSSKAEDMIEWSLFKNSIKARYKTQM